jgi:hypothetical protein
MVRRNFNPAKALVAVRRAGWAIRFIKDPSEAVQSGNQWISIQETIIAPEGQGG